MNNYCVSKSLFIIKDLKMTNIIIIIKSISCVLFLLLHVIIKNISMATKSYVEQNRAHNYVWTTWCCHFNKFKEATQSLHDYLEFAQATTTLTNSVTSQKCIAAVECTCTCIRVNKSHS